MEKRHYYWLAVQVSTVLSYCLKGQIFADPSPLAALQSEGPASSSDLFGNASSAIGWKWLPRKSPTSDRQYILNDHFENPPVFLYLISALPAADKKTMGLYLLLWLVLFDCDWRSTAVLSHWWLCNHLPPICNETVIPNGLLSSLFDRRQESAVQFLCQVFRNMCLNWKLVGVRLPCWLVEEKAVVTSWGLAHGVISLAYTPADNCLLD